MVLLPYGSGSERLLIALVAYALRSLMFAVMVLLLLRSLDLVIHLRMDLLAVPSIVE